LKGLQLDKLNYLRKIIYHADQMDLVNQVYYSPIKFSMKLKSASIYVLFFTLTLAACNHPHHNSERRNSAIRRHREQIICHDSQQQVQAPLKPEFSLVSSTGPETLDLTPGIVLIKNETEIHGGEILIQILPEKKPEVPQGSKLNTE